MEKLTAFFFNWLGMAGLTFLVLTFFLYAFDLIPSTLPAEVSAEYWDTPVHEYQDTAKLENWRDGAALSGAAVAFLTAIPLPILLLAVILWLREKNMVYALVTLGIGIIHILAALHFIGVLQFNS